MIEIHCVFFVFTMLDDEGASRYIFGVTVTKRLQFYKGPWETGGYFHLVSSLPLNYPDLCTPITPIITCTLSNIAFKFKDSLSMQ